ncbi:cytochrome P450 [Streptomyces qinzhouensis]|uniref:cytochrome P450 n=1 Tax=Streptomyces qinzhouensis TaxID=2599401 RepID=UPI001FE97E67|nr:cytochrome P450 [Streptomyces qinzhouensis]
MSTTIVAPERRSYRLGRAPGGVPLLGHALPLFRTPLDYLPGLRHEGDLVRLRIGTSTAYMACTHDVVQEVLHNPRTFDKGGEFIDTMKLLLGDGVGTCPAAKHRRQRRFIQPAFQRDRLDHYCRLMHDEVTALAGSWQPGGVIDAGTEMSRLTTRVTARMMFSADIASDAVAAVQRNFPVVWKGVYRRMVIPLPLLHALPTPANIRFTRALRRLDDVIDRMLTAYRRDTADRDDLLTVLLAARDEHTGRGMTDTEIHDELMTVLAAGVETPASGLTWAFHLLGENPDVERKLLAEVDSVLGGRPARATDLPALPYTQRVVAEALRLYPPVWFITRRAVTDTWLAGHPVPAGSSIVFSPYALHRDPTVFREPERFDPDRWLPENACELPRNATITFGGGSRKCLGDVLANQEVTLALASITAAWRLRPLPGHRIRPVAKAELTTGPLPMTTEARA